MHYTTRKEIEATGVDMEDMYKFLMGQTGGIVDGEFVPWTHDVNRYLRRVGLPELKGNEYEN